MPQAAVAKTSISSPNPFKFIIGIATIFCRMGGNASEIFWAFESYERDVSVWNGCNFWFRVTISSILHASCLTRLSEISSIQVNYCTVAEFCPSKSVPTFSAGRRPSFVKPGKAIHFFEPMDLKSGKDHNRIISISFHRHWLSQHCLTPSIASWCQQKLDWLEDEIWNEMDERGWHLGKGSRTTGVAAINQNDEKQGEEWRSQVSIQSDYPPPWCRGTCICAGGNLGRVFPSTSCRIVSPVEGRYLLGKGVCYLPDECMI